MQIFEECDEICKLSPASCNCIKWVGLIMATWSDRLTKTDIKTVRKEVLPAAAKYYDLGIELSLDPDYLNTLTSKSDEENLRELLLRWLSGVDPEPTWKALCDALRNSAIKHELLADEIEEKYCKVESNNTQEESGDQKVPAVEQSVIPVDSALTAHSEIEICTGDHNIISSLSTPTIESASWVVPTQDSQPTLRSSSSKHVTSSSNKSPHKVFKQCQTL